MNVPMLLWGTFYGGAAVGLVRAGRRTWQADHNRVIAAVYVALTAFCIVGVVGSLLALR